MTDEARKPAPDISDHKDVLIPLHQVGKEANDTALMELSADGWVVYAVTQLKNSSDMVYHCRRTPGLTPAPAD